MLTAGRCRQRDQRDAGRHLRHLINAFLRARHNLAGNYGATRDQIGLL